MGGLKHIFPFAFSVFLVGLNQINGDRLTGENLPSLLYECAFGDAVRTETQRSIGQLRFICHSEAKEQNGLWFGTQRAFT